MARGLVSMAALRAMLTKIGFANVQTLLQSGNLVFQVMGATVASSNGCWKLKVENGCTLRRTSLSARCGSGHRIVRRNPFPKEARADPGHLVLVVLKRRSRRERVADAAGGHCGARAHSRRRPAVIHNLSGWARPLASDECAHRKEDWDSRHSAKLEDRAEIGGARERKGTRINSRDYMNANTRE